MATTTHIMYFRIKYIYIRSIRQYESLIVFPVHAQKSHAKTTISDTSSVSLLMIVVKRDRERPSFFQTNMTNALDVKKRRK